MDHSLPASNVVKVTIGDHHYEITPHPPTRGGRKLALQIMALGAEPLARIVSTFLEKKAGALNMSEMADKDLGEVFTDLDLSSLGKDIGFILDALSENEQLLEALFQHTKRDDKHLRVPTAFDEAYAANYMEMGKAVLEIIKVNKFVAFGTSPGE